MMLGSYLGLALVISAYAQQQQTIPCGLPPFVTKLPEKQSQLLKEIWAGYESGTDCSTQQNRTFEVVATLTDAERAAVFSAAQENDEGIPVEDQFDTTPAFIKSLSKKIKDGFDEIWTNIGLLDQEKHEKLREYAAKHFNKEQKEGFDIWLNKIIEARQQINSRVEKLPQAAKEMLSKIMKVREEERKLLNSLTPEMQRMLDGLI
ncbi:unnamed protein product [Cylicocyclus nassatus]|uniref:DUF148 domain-containing protein n=1 Tax=Cylicocyclus nassatus TaxID=53992 RepID=A0AA36GUM0_CYLNA|nr:unnamed protein product [Cylicocyclus nassatus]